MSSILNDTRVVPVFPPLCKAQDHFNEDLLTKKNFANESAFLMISSSSARFLRLNSSHPSQNFDDTCFRANITLSGDLLPPFEEDNWAGHNLDIGGLCFQVINLCKLYL